MTKQRKQKKRIEKLRDKYRLIIYNDDSFEEVLSYRLNRLNVFFLVGFSSTVLIGVVYLLIAYTPLKEYVIPDYPKLEEREKIIATALRTDSLENQMRMHIQYLEVLKVVLSGGDAPQYVYPPDSVGINIKDIRFERSIYDSLLRLEVQEYEAFNLSYQQNTFAKTGISHLNFVPPVRGIISQSFSPKDTHWGVDIVASKDAIIRSVLSGTIIMAAWTLETGYIIGVQHDNNFVSFYKHNSKLLKKTGDRISAGEGIAIIGNTGEYTTGPHLHFELWHEGKPVNPERYIVF